MKLIRAHVTRLTSGPDKVSIETDVKPSPMFPFDGPLYLDFECARGTGSHYVNTHFPELSLHVLDINQRRIADPEASLREIVRELKSSDDYVGDECVIELIMEQRPSWTRDEAVNFFDVVKK